MVTTKSKKSAQTTGRVAPRVMADEVLDASGSEADYDAFIGDASALRAADVAPMRADPELARHNVQAGVASLLAVEARLAKLPETKLAEVKTLPRLALAVIFADTQIERAASTGELAKKLAKGRALRGVLLPAAESLAASGALPTAKVKAIKAGRGAIDTARDCVDLVALFRKHAAAIKGKHPVTAAQLKDASEVGTELLALLKPGRARRNAASPAVGAEERNRLWTLLVARHERLRRAGAYLFGLAELDERVPSLQASRGGRGKKAKVVVVVAAPVPSK